MRRRTFLGALVAIPVAARSALAQQRSLVVGTDIELKPFDFAQDGKYVGFDQDIWGEIAKQLGRSYTVSPMDFGALIPALQTSNIDVAISSIFITEQRKKVVDFSDPYYTSAIGALVATGDTSIKSGKDLDGKPIAAMTGAAGAKWVQQNAPNAKVTLFPQVANMYLELRAKRVAAVVHDYPNLAYYANTDGRGDVMLLPEPVGDKIPCGIAFPKGSNLVAPTNEALRKMHSDGGYDAIYKKWFGQLPA